MKRYIQAILVALLVTESLFLLWDNFFPHDTSRGFLSAIIGAKEPIVPPAVLSSPFIYSFNVPGSLSESDSMKKSSSPYWWLNSGGRLDIASSSGRTVHGKLPERDKWRLAYARTNPVDTDNGDHPQNIFRLVGRQEWHDIRQEAYFRILGDNASKSPNRNASNGILLMSRYQDGGDTLYYAGLRVDGAAVIKKKMHGEYFTLAYKELFPDKRYDRDSAPNLLPRNEWIGLRSEIVDLPGGGVRIHLYADIGKTGAWKLLLSVDDDGRTDVGSAITESGYAGIRADFMDVELSDYRAEELSPRSSRAKTGIIKFLSKRI